MKTPVLEYTPDNVQLAYGPRIQLLLFGGQVKPGIDSRWCGHASIPKTAIDLLGLPPLGVSRLGHAVSLANLIDLGRPPNPAPPAHGATVSIPRTPTPAIPPKPIPPPPAVAPVPVGEIILRGGGTLPLPNAGHSVATLARNYAGVLRELRGKPRVPAEEAIRQARAPVSGTPLGLSARSSSDGAV